MPVIRHEGRDYVLVILRYKCLLCTTIAESSSTRQHAIVACSCGHLSLDGGITAGGTINGDPRAMEDLSVYRTEDLQLPQEVLTARHARICEKMYPKR